MAKLSFNSQTLSDHAAVLDDIATFYQAILDQVPPGGQPVVNALEATGSHHADAHSYQQWLNGSYRTDLQDQITYLHNKAKQFRDLAAQIDGVENEWS